MDNSRLRSAIEKALQKKGNLLFRDLKSISKYDLIQFEEYRYQLFAIGGPRISVYSIDTFKDSNFVQISKRVSTITANLRLAVIIVIR